MFENLVNDVKELLNSFGLLEDLTFDPTAITNILNDITAILGQYFGE